MHHFFATQMVLTPAEKQRRYREKRNADPERRLTYLLKERESWHKRKRLVSDLGEREKRYKRKQWRKTKAEQRAAKQPLSGLCTPPSTPDGQEIGPPQTGPSRQYLQGKRTRKTNTKRLAKRLNKLQTELQQKLTWRFKKRWQREVIRNRGQLPDTPRTKTRKLLRYATSSAVKRTLNFHHVLIQSVIKRYQETKSQRQKQHMSRLFTGCVS